MRNSSTSLFLMELMISILFFAISGAVCIQLFVKAHTINELSQDKSKAVLIAQDICEYFHHSDGDKQEMLSYYSAYENTDEDNTYLLFFSQSGNPCSGENTYFIAKLTFKQELSYHILSLEIKNANDQTILYSTQLRKYVQSTL